MLLAKVLFILDGMRKFARQVETLSIKLLKRKETNTKSQSEPSLFREAGSDSKSRS